MTPVALVTGASSGLGRAMAIELARNQRPLALLARDTARLEATAEDARAAGSPLVRIVTADVRDADGLDRHVRDACGTAGMSMLVHAAGVLSLGSLASMRMDDLAEGLMVNIVGSAGVLRASLPHLERARGRVVVISSITARLALPGGFGAYAASKWGLRGFAETIRPELAERGIQLTMAYPSILDTPMVAPLAQDAAAPAVYRVFDWHDCELAARRILRDAELGRRTSYVTAGDRASAWLAGAMPATFAALLRFWVRSRDRGTAPR